DYQKKVLKNAKDMEKVLKQRGINIISGVTSNHLLLLDITNTGFSGKEAEAALCRANITVKTISIPNDPRSPFVTSGLR
ncbi:serine hydroxymethyltransferase, partial [Francisella tularensis subsp. holarctica]|nr:serine hydroxymethyltransferase [Francisella tularensis subsp. holarctica]